MSSMPSASMPSGARRQCRPTAEINSVQRRAASSASGAEERDEFVQDRAHMVHAPVVLHVPVIDLRVEGQEAGQGERRGVTVRHTEVGGHGIGGGVGGSCTCDVDRLTGQIGRLQQRLAIAAIRPMNSTVQGGQKQLNRLSTEPARGLGGSHRPERLHRLAERVQAAGGHHRRRQGLEQVRIQHGDPRLHGVVGQGVLGLVDVDHREVRRLRARAAGGGDGHQGQGGRRQHAPAQHEVLELAVVYREDGDQLGHVQGAATAHRHDQVGAHVQGQLPALYGVDQLGVVVELPEATMRHAGQLFIEQRLRTRTGVGTLAADHQYGAGARLGAIPAQGARRATGYRCGF